mmetsp:Transcript_34140/g.47526  ORF Transcript_34140/g.47526 Transcript_34140/m.47526 type:complete len:87 (-) Transcript_34140:997-1257(-)
MMLTTTREIMIEMVAAEGRRSRCSYEMMMAVITRMGMMVGSARLALSRGCRIAKKLLNIGPEAFLVRPLEFADERAARIKQIEDRR